MSSYSSGVIARYPVLQSCADDMIAAAEILFTTFKAGNRLLVCGNGGSAADSEHIVGELMKGFLKARRIPAEDTARLTEMDSTRGSEIAARLQGALPAISLTSQLSLNTAVGNDTEFAMIFAQQVYGLGRKGDALLGISTSGNSTNVINAFIVARAQGLRAIALTGRSGGRLLEYADVCVRVPADNVAEIQELHLPVYHAWCIDMEARFFSE